jgi:hypothetical protein
MQHVNPVALRATSYFLKSRVIVVMAGGFVCATLPKLC